MQACADVERDEQQVDREDTGEYVEIKEEV